jgi:hypothetical protein
MLADEPVGEGAEFVPGSEYCFLAAGDRGGWACGLQ